MNVHTIRLSGPWQRVKESGARQRIRLPIDCLAGEETRLMRRFGRPGRLDEGERVWLVIAGLSGQAQVLLNQSPLALEPSLEGMRVDITQWLLRDNWLAVDWSGVESGGLKGPVWLECVTPQAGSDSSGGRPVVGEIEEPVTPQEPAAPQEPAPPTPEDPSDVVTPRVSPTQTLREMQPPSDEAVSGVIRRMVRQHDPASLEELVEETSGSDQKKVFMELKAIEADSGERFAVSPEVLVFDGPRVADGAYPLPESLKEDSLSKWVKRHPQIPGRSSLIQLLHVYGLRLPTVAQARAAFGSGRVDDRDLPIPVRDEGTRLMMSDGRLVYAGDLDQPGASASRLALMAVRELASRETTAA